MRTATLVALLLALPGSPCPARAESERCPSPQLPAGSVVYSAREPSAFGPTVVHVVGVDGQHVYWSDGRGQLWRAGKSGGQATRVVEKEAHNFLLVGGTIYYAGDRSIRKIASAGGTPETVVKESEDPIELVSDGRYLFYSMFDGSPVRQLELATARVVRRYPVTAKDQVTLALDRGQLYVASYKTGTITRHPIAGGAPKVLVRGERTLVGVSLDEDALYYSVEKGGVVKRAPKQGGRAIVLARDQVNQESLHLDGPWVYWFDWRGGHGHHTLWRVRRTGGKVEKVLGELCSPHHLAIDESGFTFENGAAGTVIRIPRPN